MNEQDLKMLCAAIIPLVKLEIEKNRPADIDYDAIVERAAKSIPAPVEPEPIDVEAIAQKAAEIVPTPKDGKDAEPVSVSEVADAVAAGFEKRFSDLTLSWERQARDAFEKAIDRMPKPKDGKDAAQISELDIVQDGRNVTIKLGDQERTIKIDSVIYREVWKEGEYEKGDAATYGGSLWIAKEDTNEVPGTSKAWQLAVKKGRDGKDLRDSASKHDSKKGVKAWG